MKIDKEIIKLLSSDTRIRIMKMLTKRRMMPSELSKFLEVAPSTVIEHLKKLEESDLVKKVETGHKWIYYEITEKGLDIIKPKAPIYLILSLFTGIVIVVYGSIRFTFGRVYFSQLAGVSTEIGKISERPPVPQPIPMDWVSLIIIALGMFLITISLIKILKKH